jgi:hypothetical protein
VVAIDYSLDDDGTMMLNEVSLPDDTGPTDPGFDDLTDDAADPAE